MPHKRTRAEMQVEDTKAVLDLILEAASTMGFPPDFNKDLTALRTHVLSNLSSKEKEKTKAATDFMLDETIKTFGLKFDISPFYKKYHWDIENEVTNEFSIIPCFESLLYNYGMNFDRASESMCRTAIDFVLNECLTVMKGLNADARPNTPSPLHDIRIYGEVSFTHEVISGTTIPNIVIGGRVDYGIGRVLESGSKNATEERKRRFYSLLLLVEAKFEDSDAQAIPQLIVYLASLRQSRLQRNRTDASVYGLASDGYAFIFVKISHDGTVMRSDPLYILGNMKKILGCLKYVLEITASRSPKSTPERNNGDRDEDEADELLNLDDNNHIPGAWEDERDEEDD